MSRHFGYLFIILSLVFGISCQKRIPEMEIGKIDQFLEDGNKFSVNVKNLDIGWYLDLDMDNMDLNQEVLQEEFSLILHNTSDLKIKTSFREEYNYINPGSSKKIYQGTFKDFWYQGGALSIFNGASRLIFSIEIVCPSRPVLKNPIRVFLYTRDAEILPF